jgi:uncharacterized Zn finger protein
MVKHDYYKCRKCGTRETVHRVVRFNDGSVHVRCECAQCGKYFRYVSVEDLLNNEYQEILKET